mgnify:FL=1
MNELSFKYRVVMLTLGIIMIAPVDIISASIFTDYFMGLLIVYWGYLILFSNRYFISNSMFVQRFPSLKSLYWFYIKKELQLATSYIVLLDIITVAVNIVVSRILCWIPITLDKISLKWIVLFTILNIIGIVVLRLIMLWIQLMYSSHIATIVYCLYVGISALFSYISIPAIEIDFSIISPAFKGEFFNWFYLGVAYIIVGIIGGALYQNVKRGDRKL